MGPCSWRVFVQENFSQVKTLVRLEQYIEINKQCMDIVQHFLVTHTEVHKFVIIILQAVISL